MVKNKYVCSHSVMNVKPLSAKLDYNHFKSNWSQIKQI